MGVDLRRGLKMRFVQFLDFCLVAEDRVAKRRWSEMASGMVSTVLEAEDGTPVVLALPVLFALIWECSEPGVVGDASFGSSVAEAVKRVSITGLAAEYSASSNLRMSGKGAKRMRMESVLE